MSIRSIFNQLFALAPILLSGCFKGELNDLKCYLDSDCDPLKCVNGKCADAPKTRPVALAAGADHTCAVLGTGGVRCWGSNLGRQLGDPNLGASSCNATPPTKDIDFGPDGGEALRVGVSVSVYGNEEIFAHTCALFTNDRMKCWGAGGNEALSGWLGYENDEIVTDPASVGFVPLTRLVRDLSVGDRYTCVIYEEDELACWGSGDKPIVHSGDSAVGNAEGQISALGTIGLGGDGRVLSVSTGYEHACAVREDGTAWCWGSNSYGQGGRGNFDSPIDEPVQVDLAQPTKVVDVHAGYYHTCALLANNKVTCWGCNGHRELGVPDNDSELKEGGACFYAVDHPDSRGVASPVLSSLVNAVVMERQILQLVSGHSHNCILLDDDSIYCWGDNRWNQLADAVADGTTYSAEPVKVKFHSIDDSLRPARLASGGSHTCALMTSGDIYCWGDNVHGQLGQGHCDTARSPRKVNL